MSQDHEMAVYVSVSEGVSGRPGLLLEWENRDRGWYGRVVYVIDVDVSPRVVRERWFPAALISPLEERAERAPQGGYLPSYLVRRDGSRWRAP